MIQTTENNTFPCFYPCADEAEFQSLDTQACEMLGYPDAGATDYANQLVDINGVIYFIINYEVVSLFTQAQLDTCVQYDEIVFPENPPLN
jgi:hypothetical protein